MGRFEVPLSPPGPFMERSGVRWGLLAPEGKGQHKKGPKHEKRAMDPPMRMLLGKHELARVDSNHHRRFQRPVSCH